MPGTMHGYGIASRLKQVSAMMCSRWEWLFADGGGDEATGGGARRIHKGGGGDQQSSEHGMNGSLAAWLSHTWRRVVFRWRREQLDAGLQEELAFHFEQFRREQNATGLAPQAAVDVDPNVPVGRGQTLEEMVSGSIADFRSMMRAGGGRDP